MVIERLIQVNTCQMRLLIKLNTNGQEQNLDHFCHSTQRENHNRTTWPETMHLQMTGW